MKLKTLNKGTVVNNYIDMETGELKDRDVYVKKQVILVKDREQFAFQYAAVVGALNQLSGTAIKLLIHCSLEAEYNTNKIHLNQITLAPVAEQFGSTLGSMKHAVGELVKAGVLIRLGSAAYRVNPRYYWRGEGPKRQTTLKYMLEIECPNC